MTYNEDLEARRQKTGKFGNKTQTEAGDVIDAPETPAAPALEAFRAAETALNEAKEAAMVAGQAAILEEMASHNPVIDSAVFAFDGEYDDKGWLYLREAYDADGERLVVDSDTHVILNTVGNVLSDRSWLYLHSAFRKYGDFGDYIIESPAAE